MKSSSLDLEEKNADSVGKSETKTGAFVSTKEVDTAAELAAGAEGELDPKEAQRIR